MSGEKHLPASDRKGGLCLALSGDGFRATLFHLGALQRLNELGLLGKIKTIFVGVGRQHHVALPCPMSNYERVFTTKGVTHHPWRLNCRRVSVALLIMATPGTAEAQRSTQDISQQSLRATLSADADKENKKIEFDPAYIDQLLAGFPLKLADRQLILKAIATLFDNGAPSKEVLVDKLKNLAGMSNNAASIIAELILDHSPEPPTDVLSALSASAWTDRIYSTVDLISFAKQTDYGSFQARVIAGVGLASDSSAAATTSDNSQVQRASQTRIRSAQLLSAIREGGPIALNLAYQYKLTRPSRPYGLGAAFAMSIAQTGKSPLEDPQGFTAGATTEVNGFVRSGDLAHPSTLLATVRAGYREAKDGILIDLDEKVLRFVQASIEFRVSRVAVPLGLVMSWANKPFQQYLRTVQFFGIAAF